jgi:hypothetical protein
MKASDWDGWMPVRVRTGPSGPMVDWIDFRDLRFSESFFSQTASRALRQAGPAGSRRESPIDWLQEFALTGVGIPPTGFIFHLSRCGSTLVSQMLAAIPAHVVLSEPPALDEVLGLPPAGATSGPDPRIAWIQGLVGAWSRRRPGETRLFLKFDCWQIWDLPLIQQAFPDVPWIFLYREPVEVLVSHQRAPGSQMVPGLLDARRLGLDPESVDPAAGAEYAARVLAQICAAALRAIASGGGLLVNYRDLPGAVTGEIARHFGVRFGPEEELLIAAAARLDAKQPSRVYQPDSAAKQQAATEELRRRANIWLSGLYERLEAARGLARARISN